MWKTSTFKKAINLLSGQIQFLLIFLFALTALLWLWKLDGQFHNEKPPIVIVGDSEVPDSSGNAKDRLTVSKVLNNLISPAPPAGVKKAPARPADDQKIADQKNTLELAILGLNQVEMNDVADLKKRLTEQLIQLRDNKQDFLRDKIANLGVESLQNKLAVLAQFENAVKGDNKEVNLDTVISDLERNRNAETASTRIIVGATEDQTGFDARTNLINLLNKLRGSNKDSVDKKVLYRNISESFRDTESANAIIGYKNEIANISNNFDAIFSKVSASDLRVITKPEGWNAWAVSILDDKGPLNIVYSLATIILGFTVISSILFVIVQPLTKIFFLSGYTDVLPDKIRDALTSGAASAGPPLAVPAIVATVSAIGIGSMVIAGEQFRHVKEPSIAAVKSAPLVSDNALNRASFDSMERIRKSIDNLKDSVNGLKLAPGETTVVDLSPVVRALDNIYDKLERPADYGGEFKDLRERIGGTRPLGPEGSLFEKISGMDGKYDSKVSSINEDLDAVSRRVNDLAGKVGDPDKSSATQTLFGRIGKPEDSDSAKTIFGRANAVKKLADETYRVAESTFEVAESTYWVAEDTNEISAENWRNQAGRNGKNIVTQAKVLFSPEQYAVSVVALRQIDREIRKAGIPDQNERRLLERLYDLTRRKNSLNRAQIAKELSTAAGESTWREWRPLILRYTRVSRR